MRYSWKLFFLLLTAALPAQEPLPQTKEGLSVYMDQVEARIAEQVNYFCSLQDEQKSVETMLRPWSRLGNDLLSNFAMLHYLMALDLPVSESAAFAIQGFQEFLAQKCMYNQDLRLAFKAYLNQAILTGEELSPYDRHEMLNLLETYKERGCGMLQALLKEAGTLPYRSWVSNTPQKQRNSDALTVLTLNSCFVPGDFPYLYGGVTQNWQDRVTPLAHRLLEADADVVCLQEVHAEDASCALYEALKERYTYFYGSIGPRTLGFTFETLGLPSGLFVASKYPIAQPQFTPFSAVAIPMNYGFFDFIITDEGTLLAHVYTTHMQPFNHPLFKNIRSLQLGEITEKMLIDQSEEPFPHFLCGDLNILAGAHEPSDGLIQTYFYNDYNQNDEPTTDANSTYTYYFTNYYFAAKKDPSLIDPGFQILDYALLLQGTESKIKTERVLMNRLDQPEEAISDHHGLITTIQLPKL